MGFYFNSLLASGAATTDANGGCDLQGIYGKQGALGTADITATARYPYKPVSFPAMTSNTVHKDVMSLWSKTLAYFPKGTSASDQAFRIVVAHAQNIDGSPFAWERVCFGTNPFVPMSVFQGTINSTLTVNGPPAGTLGFGYVCAKTDANGNAAVEVANSTPSSVDVNARFMEEGIVRDLNVDFSKPNSGGGTPPPPTNGGGGGGGTTPATGPNSGTNAPSLAQLQSETPGLVAGVSGVQKARRPSNRIAFSRLVTPARGSHYLRVRVNSRFRRAWIRLRLVIVRYTSGRRHMFVRTSVVLITANRLVKIRLARNVVRANVLLR